MITADRQLDKATKDAAAQRKAQALKDKAEKEKAQDQLEAATDALKKVRTAFIAARSCFLSLSISPPLASLTLSYVLTFITPGGAGGQSKP